MNRKQAGWLAIGWTAVVLTSVQLGHGASAQDAGPEWESRTAEQSKIVFMAPGLEELRGRYLRTAAEDHSYTFEIAFWSGTAAHHDKALVEFIELSPGRHFRSTRNPKQFVEDMAAFEGKDLAFQGVNRNGNRLGAIQSQRFVFENVECLGFCQYWGQSGGDSESAGTNLLYGYYCADPGQPLSEETRKAVIRGLGIKD